MASGDLLALFTPLNFEPPSSNAATRDNRNSRPCLDFDASADESSVWTYIMPPYYDGGGVEADVWWAASTDNNNSHTCDWEASFEDWSALDLDGDSFAAAQSNTGSPSSTLGVATNTTISFTDGAQMDSVGAGDPFRFKLTRDADGGDMTGDGEMFIVALYEA